MYFDKIGIVKRLTPLSDDPDKEDYQTIGLHGFDINVQPASDEATALTGGVYGKTYTVYTTQSGIFQGDRLTVSGTFIDGVGVNKELNVTSVANYHFAPMKHFEITCTEITE